MTDLFADAEKAYAAACARRRGIEKAWRELGSPWLSTGSQGQQVEHPLVAMMRLHDVLCDRLRTRIRKAHAGPEPSAVINFRGATITRKLEAVPATKTEPKAGS